VLDQGQRLLGLYGMHLPERMPDDILKPHLDMLDAIAAKNPDAAEAAASADALVLIEEFRESLARRASDGMAVASGRESNPAKVP
jgi:DNA-binding GntR family transcriptional regulator